jgi:hypothetical protein
MADLSRQNSKEKSCPVFSLSFGMQIGTVKISGLLEALIGCLLSEQAAKASS